MDYNRTIFAGRLIADPLLKFLPSQTAIAEFRVASNRRWKDTAGNEQTEVCFLDCIAYGAKGEQINRFFAKGRNIFVEGRLKHDQWEDKQSGMKRSKHSLVVENWEFVDPPPEKSGDAPEQKPPQRKSYPRRTPDQTPESEKQVNKGPDGFTDEGDIPF